ncbi:hypothetical protein ALP43_04256 [Pseudomonas azotoformans]|uniref:phage virion morphogenesis protein n=1 Tax=Pseudomonas syringae TaxID=317 RepID=UPI000EFDB504|nr:phage virion morphogenesis protein [Pseudomonas azotoformans]RMT70257.1 hypothetical protein ALP43_04256 [Pseudomonas azotoformans]
MTDQLHALEQWAGVLLEKLEPSARTQLARDISKQVRRSQQLRVKAQRDPAGNPFAPRKQRDLRGKKGRIKRKMFQKLQTARHLKAQANSNAVSVGFTGRVSRIARVHQFGLRDRAERGAKEVKYTQRRVLGLSESDVELIRDTLLTHLSL